MQPGLWAPGRVGPPFLVFPTVSGPPPSHLAPRGWLGLGVLIFAGRAVQIGRFTRMSRYGTPQPGRPEGWPCGPHQDQQQPTFQLHIRSPQHAQQTVCDTPVVFGGGIDSRLQLPRPSYPRERPPMHKAVPGLNLKPVPEASVACRMWRSGNRPPAWMRPLCCRDVFFPRRGPGKRPLKAMCPWPGVIILFAHAVVVS